MKVYVASSWRCRGEDYTLESIGAVLELSRERIRQMAEEVV